MKPSPHPHEKVLKAARADIAAKLAVAVKATGQLEQLSADEEALNSEIDASESGRKEIPASKLALKRAERAELRSKIERLTVGAHTELNELRDSVKHLREVIPPAMKPDYDLIESGVMQLLAPLYRNIASARAVARECDAQRDFAQTYLLRHWGARHDIIAEAKECLKILDDIIARDSEWEFVGVAGRKFDLKK